MILFQPQINSSEYLVCKKAGRSRLRSESGYSKIILFLFSLLLSSMALDGQAQMTDYADSGNGLHQDDIIWFTWAGTDLADGIHNGDQVIYSLPNGGTLQLDFSNVSVNYPIPDPTPSDGETPDGYRPSDMKIWCGATLYTAYDLSGSTSEALISDISAAGVVGDGENGQDIAFDIDYTLTINGVSVPVDIIVADPETTNPATGFQEENRATTNVGLWGIAEDINGSTYGLSGLGTSVARITNTETGVACSGGVNSGTNSSPLLLSKGISGTTSKLTFETLFPNGDGHQGIALGALMPCDQSDAPLSYGVASHLQNLVAPFSGTGSLNNVSTLYLGSIRGDTDYYINSPSLLGSSSTGDDIDDIDDEDGLLNSSFAFNSLPGGPMIIPASDILLNNGTGSSATLHAWVDFDGNGTFDTDEYGSVNVSDGATTTDTDLVFITPIDAIAGNRIIRLRLSSDASLSSASPAGIAINGEVEDYLISMIDGCSDPLLIDTDGDTVNDLCDLDDDNDGIPDSTEGTADTDLDGIIDRLDLDSDGDGISDLIEAGHNVSDTDFDGILDGAPSAFGANGLYNLIETSSESGLINYTLANSDADGILNFRELDSDDDGCYDVTEGGFNDSNGDGLVD